MGPEDNQRDDNHGVSSAPVKTQASSPSTICSSKATEWHGAASEEEAEFWNALEIAWRDCHNILGK